MRQLHFLPRRRPLLSHHIFLGINSNQPQRTVHTTQALLKIFINSIKILSCPKVPNYCEASCHREIFNHRENPPTPPPIDTEPPLVAKFPITKLPNTSEHRQVSWSDPFYWTVFVMVFSKEQNDTADALQTLPPAKIVAKSNRRT